MTDPVNTAIDTYGPMAQIIAAVPELQGFIQQAVAGQWSSSKLTAAVQSSQWYQTHSDAARNLIMTQAADPGTFQQNIANQADKINIQAQAMGRSVDAKGLAYQALLYGWDDAQIQHAIGSGPNAVIAGANGARIGGAAQIETQLEQVAQSYGVPYTQQWLDASVAQIQSGRDSLDGLTMLLRQNAKSQYPQYAAQLDAGQTMTQIADPYMAQMAKTLEIPQSSVTLNDPYIKKALSVRDPQSGAVTSQSMWQFEQTLKKDPRYDYTTQAKTDAYSTLAQVGKDFGFTGGTTGGMTTG